MRETADPAAVDAVAALFAVDPAGLGGVVLRARAGPARERWLARLAALLPASVPLRRVPLHVADERLLGGLDLAATLRAGHPVAERGVLAEADGGVLLLAMAERLPADTAARIGAVLDTGERVLERDGVALRSPSRIGVVALDEGIADDEQVPAALLERLAFRVELEDGAAPDDAPGWSRPDVIAARARLGAVRAGDAVVEALCAAALAFGVATLRAPVLALRAARAAAALAGRDDVAAADAAWAARLVLAVRAAALPPDPAEADAAPPSEDGDPEDRPPEASPSADEANAAAQEKAVAGDASPDLTRDSVAVEPATGAEEKPVNANDPAPKSIQDVVLAAARAAIPPRLLAGLKAAAPGRPPALRPAGQAGALQVAKRRGRPCGVRRGDPRGGVRLNLLETLRAAAPWQALRRSERPVRTIAGPAPIEIRREDFRVTRLRQRGETATLFVVDASGSAALHRLAEAKGAVELLLADCYVRRDRVAVIAFRGRTAELLLPPTRSLVRAKRSLAGLPGGGGTPLAAGIDAALALADVVRRRGCTPLVVLLTDGHANVGRGGVPGRAQGKADALVAARELRAAGFAALLLDTAAQPQDSARQLAQAMAARYLPLPHAGAALLSQAVRASGAAACPPRRGTA